MVKSVVTEIGKNALGTDDIIILFNEEATESLKNFSVIQQVDSKSFNLSEGSQISFDEQIYNIVKVGALANKHLEELGHVTLVFKDPKETDELVNALFLEPYTLPDIKEGTVITYK